MPVCWRRDRVAGILTISAVVRGAGARDRRRGRRTPARGHRAHHLARRACVLVRNTPPVRGLLLAHSPRRRQLEVLVILRIPPVPAPGPTAVGEHPHGRVAVMQQPRIGASAIPIVLRGAGPSHPSWCTDGFSSGLTSTARSYACCDQLDDPGIPRQLNAEVLLSSIESSSCASG